MLSCPGCGAPYRPACAYCGRGAETLQVDVSRIRAGPRRGAFPVTVSLNDVYARHAREMLRSLERENREVIERGGLGAQLTRGALGLLGGFL